MGTARVLTWDPGPFGLPEILAVTHVGLLKLRSLYVV